MKLPKYGIFVNGGDAMVIDFRDKKIIIFGLVFIVILIGLLVKPLIIEQTLDLVGDNQKSIKIPISRVERGNKEYFIPDGTYLLSKPVEFGIYQLDSFNLKTVKNNSDGAEAVYIKPKAVISLVINSQKKCLYFNCPDPILRKEELLMKTDPTPIGQITFEGAFYNQQGKPWLEPVAEYKETIAHGLLTVEKNSTIVYSEMKDFIYMDGAYE